MRRGPRDPARLAEVRRRWWNDERPSDYVPLIAQRYSVSERTVYTDIKRIQLENAEAARESLNQRRAKHMARLRARLNRAITRKDNHGEDFTLDKMARLEGLYINLPDDPPPPEETAADRAQRMTSTEARARIEQLLAIATARVAAAAAIEKRNTRRRKGE